MSPGGSGQYPSCTFSSTLAGEYVPTALGLGFHILPGFYAPMSSGSGLHTEAGLLCKQREETSHKPIGLKYSELVEFLEHTSLLSLEKLNCELPLFVTLDFPAKKCPLSKTKL